MVSPGKLVAAIILAAIAGPYASACKCGGIRGRTAWETAEKEARSSLAIFEGTPERFAVQSDILSAKPGDMVPADADDQAARSAGFPHLVITFRVKRVYQGDLGPQVQVRTGVGGGDCGAAYQTGMDYLVYDVGRIRLHWEYRYVARVDGSAVTIWRPNYAI